jgi:hypothetical protein
MHWIRSTKTDSYDWHLSNAKTNNATIRNNRRDVGNIMIAISGEAKVHLTELLLGLVHSKRPTKACDTNGQILLSIF